MWDLIAVFWHIMEDFGIKCQQTGFIVFLEFQKKFQFLIF